MLERLKPKYPELLAKLGTPYYGGIECDDGWEKIIDDLLAEIMAIAKEKACEIPEVSQIKEKFGELRVYLNSNDYGHFYDAIGKAGHLSAKTCEACGNPGVIQNCNGWMRAVCGDHDCVVYPRNKR